MMSGKLIKGTYGVMRTDHIEIGGFYIGEWTSYVYTL